MIRRLVLAAICLTVPLCLACRTSAPIVAWTPAELESAVGHRVGISSIDGPKSIAVPLRSKMLALSPRDSGRALVALDPHQLASQNLSNDKTIRLVRATEETPTVLTAVAVAKEQGIDYLLTGEILPRNEYRRSNGVRRVTLATGTLQSDEDIPVVKASQLDSNGRLPDPDSASPQQQSITLSWQLISVKDNRSVGGKPFSVDIESARTRYPDLAFVADPTEVLTTAAARDAYRLIAPSLRHHQVDLVVPRFSLASRHVRRGVVQAKTGDWGAAKEIWEAVVDRHPRSSSAIHNLALAAAASQDFSKAKQLARRAVRLNPVTLHQETLAWIEQRQRDYHDAFELPDPPEGWFLVRPLDTVTDPTDNHGIAVDVRAEDRGDGLLPVRPEFVAGLRAKNAPRIEKGLEKVPAKIPAQIADR